MRIITVNLPASYLKIVDSLTGNGGLYPSRSELVRVAVRDYLIEELAKAAAAEKTEQKKQTPIFTGGMKIRVKKGMTLMEALNSKDNYTIVKETVR